MCFLISYSNCFSCEPNNSVHVQATKLYHDNDDEADDVTGYRKNALGTSRKTKTTSKKTSWIKDKPCRNGHDVTTSLCKQEPNEPNATSWYKQEQLATVLYKMEPEDEAPPLESSPTTPQESGLAMPSPRHGMGIDNEDLTFDLAETTKSLPTYRDSSAAVGGE